VLDLGAPATTMTAMIEGIEDDQLGRATPCGETTVGELIAHVLMLSVAFRDAAAKVDGPTTSTPPTSALPALPQDWRQIAPGRLSELAAAWRDSAAWDGMTQAGGVRMPGSVTAVVANNELVLHGWDLAVASGQRFEVAGPNLEASWQMVSATPDTPEARQGLFGPVVAVPADASLLDRVLGGAGRDPQWVAPAG
jgi:uncharacterized protein (TIGR03086 family)